MNLPMSKCTNNKHQISDIAYINFQRAFTSVLHRDLVNELLSIIIFLGWIAVFSELWSRVKNQTLLKSALVLFLLKRSA